MNDIRRLVMFLIVGLVAGWLAGIFMRGRHLGVLASLVVGVIGALIGGFLFSVLGPDLRAFIGEVCVALVGAVVLLYLLGIVDKRK